MKITIGGREFATRRPGDVDAVLAEASGCNAAENARMLNGSPSPGSVARVLMPFLAESDRTSVAELASEIEAAGVAEIAAKIATLLAPLAPAPEKVKPE